MTEQAARFVGSIPEHYDRNLGPRIFVDFAADLTRRVAGRRPGEVLELAAGTGIVTRQLRDGLPDDCHLLATDLNEPMLDQARRKFEEGDAVQFQPADATSLPFDDDSFDVVACQFGVMFFPDKDKSYREVLRVLKPGGTYIFNVWDAWAYNPFAQIAHEAVAELFPEDPPGFYHVPFGYCDTGLIENSLASAGFAAASSETVDVISAIPSATDFATGLVYGNPLFDEIQQRGGDPQVVHQAISTSLEARLGASMPLRAIVLEASKS